MASGTADQPDDEAPVWDFDCSNGLTFWIDRYTYIADQSFGELVRAPAVTDNMAVKSLTFAETAVDLDAPVIDDVTVTWLATDFAGNTNSCTMSVRVKSKQFKQWLLNFSFFAIELRFTFHSDLFSKPIVFLKLRVCF